jgi:hypothetical protein
LPELEDFALLPPADEFTLELDFAEDELFVDEDETLPLLALSENSFSGSTKLLLSSSPQATNKNAIASAKTRVMDPRPLAKDDFGNNFFILPPNQNLVYCNPATLFRIAVHRRSTLRQVSSFACRGYA